jgi:hypothetical protein
MNHSEFSQKKKGAKIFLVCFIFQKRSPMEQFDMYDDAFDTVIQSKAADLDMYDDVLDTAIQSKGADLDKLEKEIKTVEAQLIEQAQEVIVPKKVLLEKAPEETALPKKSLLDKYVDKHPTSKPEVLSQLVQKEQFAGAHEHAKTCELAQEPVERKEANVQKRPIRRIGFTSEPPTIEESAAKRPKVEYRPRFSHQHTNPQPRQHFTKRSSRDSNKNRILLVSCENSALENKVMKYLKNKQFPVYNASNRFKVATSHILDGKENEDFAKFMEEQTLKYFDEKFTVFHFGEWLTRNKLEKAFVFGMTKPENAKKLKSKYNVLEVAMGEKGSIRPKCDWFIEFDSRDMESKVQEVFDGYR